ncbi:SDR family NAD(P)-dependent oxidoreductase [Streptosporangium sp. CA-115845]|uniref:SDR family NAD(P)-dependent oxidoreductase n=1 Tax=Streptosporangium sp. CA-115845 TaxID=3240071 RepID=UPI003D930827
MADELKGAVALVTGASSGIGRATALRLAASGAAVALVARREDRLRDLCDEITGLGGGAVALPADLTDPARAAGAVEDAVAAYGRLDILVNNAGVMLLGPVADAPEGEWERMLDLNLRAVLATTRAALPHLLAAAESAPRRVADVVNVGSVAGQGAGARAGNGVYALTKAGLAAFSESLRQELAGQRVRVALVEPGATVTELADHVRPEVLAERRKAMGDVVRLSADDVADAVGYLVTRSREVALNRIVIRPTAQV